MGQTKCRLQMLDLYFPKFEFTQIRGRTTTEHTSSFQIEYAVNNQDKSVVRVTINTSIGDKDDAILLNLQTVGVFRIDPDTDTEASEQLIRANTVSIMFPFVRSQVSLLTTQPGIQPIMIPPLNISALLDDAETVTQ